MSRKTSSVYASSSFDAVESTRRLSEEMNSDASCGQGENMSKCSPKGEVSRPTVNNDCVDSFHNGETVEWTEDMIGEVAKANQINANVGKRDTRKQRFSHISEENTVIENGHLSETPRDTEMTPRDHIVSKSMNINDDTKRKTDTRKQAKGDMFDQRSESDSDLESPDDFSDGEFSDKSEDRHTEKQVIMNHRGRQESAKGKQDNISLAIMSGDQSSSMNENQRETTSSASGTLANRNVNVSGSNTNSNGTDPSLESRQMDKEDADINPSMSKETAEYAQLTVEEIDGKLMDDEVIRQGELLDTVREVGIANLKKLQHLNWNDPALRRLFARPKISPTEAKSVKVDPDIKNTVNEFLKTNVTENFVISRVLRENYAMFYSWLASHLQTERNAWTTRFAQALDKADQERKTSLQCRNLVVEAGARLRMLVKTSSNILFGIPSKDDQMFFKTDTIRRHGKRGRIITKGPVKPIRNIREFYATDGGYASEGNSGPSRRRDNLRYNKASRDKKMDLAPSNYRLVDINKREKLNYDSDPCEINCEVRDAVNESNIGHADNKKPERSRMLNESKIIQNQKRSITSTENDDIYCDYNLDGLIMEDDKFTDWNQVLADNIDVLTDIIDTLLIDRRSCLKIMKVNPDRCESLVNAVSSYVKNRHNDTNNQRDVEKRLRTLENENRILQEEMSTLQKTLADKNRDALNLLSQLDRLESMMKSYAAPKLNKCVGTGEDMFPAVFKNNLTVGGSKTPRQSNQNSPSHMPKLTKSPRCADKEGKCKKLELPNVNGVSNFKHSRPKRDVQNQNASGITKDQEKTNSDAIDQPAPNCPDPHSLQAVNVVREPSLIEISEEKLKTLKHRAKKLEDSLHDAISSMETLNKSTQQSTGFSSSSHTVSPFDYLNNKSRVNGTLQGPKTFRKWQKASFEVSNKVSDKVGSESSLTPRVALVKRSDSFSKQQDSKETPAPDIRIDLNSEHSSLLEGRSIPRTPQDQRDQTPASTSHRAPSEKVHRHSSRSNVDEYTSDDEKSRPDNDAIYTYRRQADQANSSVQNQATNARRLRARHNTSRLLGGKQTVSKCLRCQKLFSPTDNHKLACCYHTKDKERLEHYDQSGMLIRVMYAWKCCHEPQESEGCCFGQHV